jgi:hypothetical protein
MECQQPTSVAADDRAADDRRIRLLSSPLCVHPTHHNAAVGGQLDLLWLERPLPVTKLMAHRAPDRHGLLRQPSWACGACVCAPQP